MTDKSRGYLVFILLIGGFSALNPLAIDAFVPAIPLIANSLSVTTGSVAVTLAVYTFGAAIGQLIYGPLSDRFGRKPILIIGVSGYMILAFASAAAPNLETLMTLRFLQGLTTAVGRIVGLAIVRDRYDREHAAKTLSYIAVAGGFFPILVPLISGNMLEFLSWPSVFILMGGVGVILLVAVLFLLEESLPMERRISLRPAVLFGNLMAVTRNRQFLIYTACITALSSGLFSFLTGASDYLMGTLGLGPSQLAYAFALIMICHMTGSAAAGKLVTRTGIGRLLATGVILCATAGTLMLILSTTGVASVTAIVIPMGLYMGGSSLVNAQATARTMEPFRDQAGSASTMLGFLRGAISAAVGALIGLLADGSNLPMTIGVAGSGATALAIYMIWIRPLELQRRKGVID